MQNLVITKSGKELLARIIAETTTVQFTRIATSDFDYTGVDLEELTELAQVRQSVLVSRVTRTDLTLVQVHGAMNNTELTEGYYIRAVGLYAQDGDGVESLYAITVAEVPDHMPAFGGKTVSGATFTLNTKVDNAEQVTLIVDPAALATVTQLAALQAELDALKEGGAGGSSGTTLYTGATLPADAVGPYLWYQPYGEGEEVVALDLVDETMPLSVEIDGADKGVSNAEEVQPLEFILN